MVLRTICIQQGRPWSVATAVGAAATAYGAGKPGTFGIPALLSTAPPTLGACSGLAISGGLPNGVAFLIAGAASLQQPFDGGTLLVAPQFVLSLGNLDGSGTAMIPLAIPNLATLCGAAVSFQAFVLDPGAAGPYHTAQTNGMNWVLGS
jgi:hypothetical protein